MTEPSETFGPVLHADASVCFILLGTANVTAVPQITNVGIDTYYSCKSEETLVAKSVNQTLWNVVIQAFVTNGTLSENGEHAQNHPPSLVFIIFPAYILPCFCTVTVCVADRTTVAPTTPTTTPSTTPVTTTPTPTLPAPTTGNYSVKADVNSTACLLASFGLRIGVKQGNVRLPLAQSSGDPRQSTSRCLILLCPSLEQKYEELNLDPNGTIASGSCGVNSSQLVLMSDAVNITLMFTNVSHLLSLHFYLVVHAAHPHI